MTRAADRTVGRDVAPDGLGQPAAEFLLSLPRHRHDLSREQVRASQRGRIALATADVVAGEGYAGATVLAIAKRAGVSRKTFYELFADKEEALLAAYDGLDHLIEQTVRAAADSASSGGTARELLAAGTTALLATLAEQPAFTRMFFLEALGAGPRVRERRDQAIEQAAEPLALALTLVRRSQDARLPPVSHELARALTGAGIEAIIRHLVNHEPETLDQLAPELNRIIDQIVLPQPNPR